MKSRADSLLSASAGKFESLSLTISQDEVVHTAGISVFVAAMFVSGELAGTGVLALPQAVAQAGGGNSAVQLSLCVVE